MCCSAVGQAGTECSNWGEILYKWFTTHNVSLSSPERKAEMTGLDIFYIFPMKRPKPNNECPTKKHCQCLFFLSVLQRSIVVQNPLKTHQWATDCHWVTCSFITNTHTLQIIWHIHRSDALNSHKSSKCVFIHRKKIVPWKCTTDLRLSYSCLKTVVWMFEVIIDHFWRKESVIYWHIFDCRESCSPSVQSRNARHKGRKVTKSKNERKAKNKR